MELSVVIPVYNEELMIEKSIKEVFAFFSSKNLSWELIVMNDGSKDRTKDILKTLCSQIPQLKAIHFDYNRGKGAAVKEGFLQSEGDYMLFFDADLSTPLSMFESFWNARGEQKVLIGSRVMQESNITKHQHPIKEYTGKLGNVLTRALLPLPFHDTQCGFKLFPGSFRMHLPLATISRASFDIEWLMIAQLNGFEITEIPVTWTNRPQSRFNALEYMRAFRELMHIAISYRRGKYHSVAFV